MIKAKDKDKRLILIWRPTSLLNVDLKILSKALADRLKKCLPFLVSRSQTVYVEDLSVKEEEVSDTLHVAAFLKIKGLVTIDIQNAFDSVDHLFLITELEKHGSNFSMFLLVLEIAFL